MNSPLKYTPGVSELIVPTLTQKQLEEYVQDIFITRSRRYSIEYVGGANSLYREGWEWLGYWRKIPVEETKKSLFKYVI